MQWLVAYLYMFHVHTHPLALNELPAVPVRCVQRAMSLCFPYRFFFNAIAMPGSVHLDKLELKENAFVSLSIDHGLGTSVLLPTGSGCI